MNKNLPLISLFIMSIISIFYWALKPKEEFYEAKWNAPDTTLAITIDGEISTSFPTNNMYTVTVKCITGTGKVEWNGAKWILTTSGITKGSAKCNVVFNTKLTLANKILTDNEVKVPLTEPGKEVSAYTEADIANVYTSNVNDQSYYVTYGTSWKPNGKGFDLTGTAVTSDVYSNSYSNLVGKYLISDDIYKTGSSSANYFPWETTNLNSVYYVVSATAEKFTYKRISSNKNATEALLASTEDDYGTSYYFRGNVKNNYVEFANKCWRIVRINGNNSVKLVLHNDNTSKVANPCSSANNSSSTTFISNNAYNYAHNIDGGDNAFIGFMYGTAGASNYASTHANINKSTILVSLDIWYTDNLSSYADKLADTIWCNDKSTVSGGLGYGTNETKYAACNRLFTAEEPTLKCPNDNNGGKLSKFTVNDTINGNGNLTYKVGLLTADELTFAGYAVGGHDSNTYLQENTSAYWWWTMTPCGTSSVILSGNYLVQSMGSGLSFDNTLNSYSVGQASPAPGVRPAISLVSSTMISGGTGTSEDPYIVE